MPILPLSIALSQEQGVEFCLVNWVNKNSRNHFISDIKSWQNIIFSCGDPSSEGMSIEITIKMSTGLRRVAVLRCQRLATFSPFFLHPSFSISQIDDLLDPSTRKEMLYTLTLFHSLSQENFILSLNYSKPVTLWPDQSTISLIKGLVLVYVFYVTESWIELVCLGIRR